MLPAHAHFHTCESIGKNSRDQSLVCLLSVQTRQTVPPVSVSLLCISNGQRTVCDNLRHPSGLLRDLIGNGKSSLNLKYNAKYYS